ncbi:hypothetical protein CT0861_06184 [Colletotrichum tofieldiae]|uniref:Uncharacterized protein n=1 Tax=Colletotrichum tofieldiae TaxID=708197 RepID=A0A166LLZ6_9PEZI|nr:hypothetical protein CT0861_06184 [Colletotrichum tofieldiae]GKT92641.1 hypothetical protein Ct61P_10491 [Colletotrichum tofieldiae]
MVMGAGFCSLISGLPSHRPHYSGESCQESLSVPPWFPPETRVSKTLFFDRKFGRPPDEENLQAWGNLMPPGRGFVVVRNQTALPDMPSLHQDLPEQHALVSVYHQLHCLWSTKESYFRLRDGLAEDTDELHLSHCWDYLRQTIMCAADTTLEWMPNPTQEISKGWGYRHECRSWDEIYDWTARNRWHDSTGIG